MVGYCKKLSPSGEFFVCGILLNMGEDEQVWHIEPVGDTKKHNTNGRSCHCFPVIKIEANILFIIHNAYDGRE